MSVVRLAILLAALAAAGCGGPSKPGLRDVSLPNLAGLDRSVETQLRGKYAGLMRLRESEGVSETQLGTAYGEYGMLLHAAEQLENAEPAYLNAQALTPADARWPYYLAHLKRSVGDSAGSIGYFNRVLELRPADVATLVWLGRAYLDAGDVDKAGPLFERARANAPKSAAVLGGLAQVALARKDFARAATLLEEAIASEPGTDSLRLQLAAAYRSLGRTAEAEAQQKRWRNTELLVPDPMRQELDLVLESGLSYELRGVRVMTDGDYRAAVEFFRRGVELTAGPTQLGRSLRHKLGTALFLSGNTAEAVQRFEEVVRLAPAGEQDEPSAKAHYSLGVIAASTGRGGEAIDHFTKAVAFSPNYIEALIGLGDALRRAGRPEAALEHYGAAVAANPQAAAARFGYALSLVRLRRYAAARDWLVESVRVQPDRPELTHALARLFAAAPDDSVRNGQRAFELVRPLFDSTKTTDVGETMAMTLAELGQFADATALQRQVLEAARQGGAAADVRRITANLRLYERRQPSRTPWPDDDPVHQPVPGPG